SLCHHGIQPINVAPARNPSIICRGEDDEGNCVRHKSVHPHCRMAQVQNDADAQSTPERRTRATRHANEIGRVGVFRMFSDMTPEEYLCFLAALTPIRIKAAMSKP